MSEKKYFELAAVFGAIMFLVVGCVMIMMPFFRRCYGLQFWCL